MCSSECEEGATARRRAASATHVLMCAVMAHESRISYKITGIRPPRTQLLLAHIQVSLWAGGWVAHTAGTTSADCGARVQRMSS